MSALTLLPPIVDSHISAFEKNDTAACAINFSLSKYNSNSDFQTVHISIIDQATGANMVNLNDNVGEGRYRKTGIILNVKAKHIDSNLYQVEIINDDLVGGWQAGRIYKIQLRLSKVAISDSSQNQTQWIAENAGEFSEWSTVCVVKPIGKISYSLNLSSIMSIKDGVVMIDGTTITNPDEQVLRISTLEIAGSFDYSKEQTEEVISYQLTLYNENNNIIEDSGEIYLNQYENNKESFNYLFSTEFESGKTYYLGFKYTTANNFIGGFYNESNRVRFTCSYELTDYAPCNLVTVENDILGLLKNVSTREQEEDEGRIAIKFYRPNDTPYSGNLCIRRSDSKSNFTIWTDVYITSIINDYINNAPVFYDYTIESGVYYKYGVQALEKVGNTIQRTKLEVMNYPIMRNFNYTFLLGKNNQQLKLMFDNVMGSFKYQIMDSKVDPIGNKYGVISRNGATYYRTFPLNGLISFWMDENKLFCDKQVIYKYEDVVDLYENYNTQNNIVQYDYIYERDFREKVLEFLQNGEYKLFKSPTEGNIIIRLVEVNCIPNQSLDRMLYSFTANAFEMDDNTMANYLKYGFYSLAEPLDKFVTKETRLGQLQLDFTENMNIFDEIIKKYDTRAVVVKNGLKITLTKIHHIKITFDDKPLRVMSSKTNDLVVGNNFQIEDKIITVYSPNRIYEFDDVLEYTPDNTNFRILGPAPNAGYPEGITVHATIDFLYDADIEIYKGKKVAIEAVSHGIGQIFEECKPNYNIYNEMYYKHFLDSKTHFFKINTIDSIEIEADPGAVFGIKDKEDNIIEQHIIGITGILRLYNIVNILNLTYLGMQDKATGSILNIPTDVIVNYEYTLYSGKYIEETGGSST